MRMIIVNNDEDGVLKQMYFKKLFTELTVTLAMGGTDKCHIGETVRGGRERFCSCVFSSMVWMLGRLKARGDARSKDRSLISGV